MYETSRSYCNVGIGFFILEGVIGLTLLKGDERLDYLLAENLRIIQSPSVFSFSLDAVLLARFAHVPGRLGKWLISVQAMVQFHYF